MSSFLKKDYVTTELAGFWVAGRKIPTDIKDGNLIPKVGHPLKLTELEAKYELAAGTISEVASKKPSKSD